MAFNVNGFGSSDEFVGGEFLNLVTLEIIFNNRILSTWLID